MNKKYLLGVIALFVVFTTYIHAKEYSSTSYYVAYDTGDKTQYALVMPAVKKVYTHKAGRILPSDLNRVDESFEAFPSYDNGKLCFPSLKNGNLGENGASVMAGQCYDVNFFYVQKEAVTEGMAFMLVYTPGDKVYEGLAGKSKSFEVVRDGNTVFNENSITDEDYTLFTFDTVYARIFIGGTLDKTSPIITIVGEKNIVLIQDGVYVEHYATAIDNIDGNVTVSLSGRVDVSTIGTYEIIYTATDSANNTATEKRIVKVVKSSVILNNLKNDLNDTSIPNTTQADYNSSLYSKRHLPDDESRRLVRAHQLVAGAVDPDPEWFMTHVDKGFSIVKAGDQYMVHLDKERSDNTIIGPVDNEKLRLVVRVQRGKDNFEYISQNNVDTYAKWSAPGILEVYVPDDLNEGRLLIGVRPNFDNVGMNAIAERWSTVIIAEVLNIKQGVKVVESAMIVFPLIGTNEPKFASGSQFNKEDIETKTKEEFVNNKQLMLPIVVKNMNLKKDDLLSYMFMDKPYSGKVFSVETRGSEQFALLKPEFFEVYDIMDTSNPILIKEGIYPENVIYREGEAINFDTNESDMIKFSQLASGEGSQKFFKRKCTVGSGTLTFKKGFSISPLDIYIDVVAYTNSSASPSICEWTSTAKGVKFNKMFLAAGPVGWAARAIGAGIVIKPIGGLGFAVKSSPLLGLDVGYSYQEGGHFNIRTETFDALGSRDLDGPISSGELDLHAEIGIQANFNAVSSDGYIGYVLKYLNIKISELGIEGKAKVKSALVSKIHNAKKVYMSDESSAIKFNISGELSIAPTKAIVKFFKYFSSSLKLKASKSEELFDAKTEAIFSYLAIDDDGSGEARVQGLAFNAHWLKKFFSGTTSEGVLAPLNQFSSLYNDQSENISYDIAECPDSASIFDAALKSPAIGCFGIICGKFMKEVELCAEIKISPVIAGAKVGEEAVTTTIIKNNAKEEITIEVTGTPLEPKDTTITIAPSSDKEVKFSKRCPSEAGVQRDISKVIASDGTVLDETDNILLCHDDDVRGDPHIVTADKLGYDYYASGDYVLSRINDVNGYEIQARFLPGHETSWPQAVALKVGEDIVEIHGINTDGHGGDGTGVAINALRIWVNGSKTFLGTSEKWNDNNIDHYLKLPSGGILAVTSTTSSNVLTFPSELTVIWPESSRTKSYGVLLKVDDSGDPFVQIQIARPDDFAGDEQGLMGNNDGNPDNDFIRRNGEVLGEDHNLSFTELYALFGADWLVRPYESLFRNPEAIQPEFPKDIITLTAEQRALGEEACAALTGFYREACIIDVGLTGSIDMVREYYANTEDLNSLSDEIVMPNVNLPHYKMIGSERVYKNNSNYMAFHYNETINIEHESGEGNFMLLVRPPRGARASLVNSGMSYVGHDDYEVDIDVDCTQVNESTNMPYLSMQGAVQLWLQDPLSGVAAKMVSEIALPCRDENKIPQYELKLGFKIEAADSNNTNLHYSREVHVKHLSNDNGVFILSIVSPEEKSLFFDDNKSEIEGVGDFNTTVTLDCTESDIDIKNTQRYIELWEKHPMMGIKATLYKRIKVACAREAYAIHVAESNETVKAPFLEFGSENYPLLYNSTYYIQKLSISREARNNTLTGYDISSLDDDMLLSNLPHSMLYSRTTDQQTAYTNGIFPYIYNLTENDGYLYYPTIPPNKDSRSHSSFAKYNLLTKTEVYHKIEDPYIANGETFSLARGWFLPLDNNHMAIAEKGKNGVIDTGTGQSIKYGGYDYLSGEQMYNPSVENKPVANNERYFYVDMMNYKPSLINIKFIADTDKVTEGIRNIHPGGDLSVFDNPNYKVNDILADLKTMYSGENNYTKDGVNEYTVKLVLDNNDSLYILVSFGYEAEGSLWGNRDLYLMKYDFASNLKNITLLETFESNYVFLGHFYKYRDVIYYMRHEGRNTKLCAYNMKKNVFVFKKNITYAMYTNALSTSDAMGVDYIITGNTIIIPRRVIHEDAYYFDIVFDILNISDATLIKTVEHEALKGLSSDNILLFKSVLSDESGVYFSYVRQTDNYDHRLIVKINVFDSKVEKDRDRYNSGMSGIIEDK